MLFIQSNNYVFLVAKLPFCNDKVTACITSRSIVTYGLTIFIPLYFAAVMILSETSANLTLTIYSIAAAAATLLGGLCADRFGFIRVIRGGYLILAPIMLIFLLITDAYFAIILLILIAIALNIPQRATIALGQKFLPNHIGTSSGIMLGVAVSIGGMVAPGIGWISDLYGLTKSMYVIAGFVILTTILAFLIPKKPKVILEKNEKSPI